MPRWTSTYLHPEGTRFIIDYHGAAGYYLYVYFDASRYEKDLASRYGHPNHQEDYDQDTFEAAADDALEFYGVPMDSWVEIAAQDEKGPAP